MASGLAVKLPLTTNDTFGAYNLITDFETLVKQNLKMLYLTDPGERMMNVNFGVGLKKRLFEQNLTSTYSEIEQEIRKQVKRYMPFIRISDIDFIVPENNPDLYPHTIRVKTYFTIVPLQQYSMFEVGVEAVV